MHDGVASMPAGRTRVNSVMPHLAGVVVPTFLAESSGALCVRSGEPRMVSEHACTMQEHPSPGPTAGGGPVPGHRGASYAAATSNSAAIAAATAASAAAAAVMAGDGDAEMLAPSLGSGAGPSAPAPSQ